ncbi:hypothetical protein P7D22_21185 [Lichenihabitans sp. Uapishka_5]|uniref:hypothetical protein n=1 Tax=Lichenihabitans sp. Uapishka_5 TaxID=3037302 RepID=UPI0029E82071|nr:hypothetical protein [Lichenihabitans sp. Uapishka_5]MDX7953681.1 hypothetical protein [Lichenihabitans sp. Uapishka_5]
MSWQALFAGVIVAVSIQILLSLLGAGVGLGMVHTTSSGSPDAGSFGTGAGLWWLVSNLIALAAGGYVSAWLAGISLRFDGVLHGLVTWGLSMLLTLYLLSSAIGGLLGGAMSVTGSTLSAAGDSVKSAAPAVAQAAGLSPDVVQQQVQSYLAPTNPDPATMNAQDAQKAVASDLSTYAMGGDDAPAAKSRIVAIMAAQMHVTPAEATKKFDDTQAKLTAAKDQAIQKAKAAADASASAASTGSFLAFGTFLLGAVAAAFGGSAAVQRRLAAATVVRRATV